MALWFELRANSNEVGWFTARRREAEIPPDRVCTYDVEIYVVSQDVEYTHVIRHNYDDGPFALVLAALARHANETDETDATDGG